LSAAEVFEQEKVEKKKNNYYLRRELRFLDAQLKTEREDLGNDLFIDFVRYAEVHTDLLGLTLRP
jgi:hypothetical protein